MQIEPDTESKNPHLLKPRKALNKAFLKVKPNRSQIEQFKENLIQLLDRTNDTESEEFHKNLVIDFLKKTYYEPNHYINTKGRNDLVIHNGNKAKTTVGVILETKKPTNRAEMLSKEKVNVKAFQELVLYYLRERITHKNLEVKYLIATNIHEWFIFDANIFEKAFAQNKQLVARFTDFEAGRLTGKTTDFFYKEIAEPFISGMQQEVEFTWFDIRNYEKPLRNNNPKDDNKLIALFKLLSPEHLLKLPFTNDSNSLDKRFYGELLHIIGLTETKQGGKKLIERQKEGQRNTGSLLENAIIQLDSMDKISRLENPSHFGSTKEERLFSVGLELSITWLNRILFLKLLEAQLLTYHKGDRSYEFLNLEKIHNYDDLNGLFFQVLARKYGERIEDVKKLFEKVPYLNSSLFEPTDIEHSTLFISNLKVDKAMPIYSATVLKDKKGKKRSGTLNALEYLFEFLNAYDFSSEGAEAIQEDNKTLINASVLGLIFEKINGYKDGSFFTPGFITMYMCRETIRKAVVQKFNEESPSSSAPIGGEGRKRFETLDDVYDQIDDNRMFTRKRANDIINSLKICDPAVGSGHFLVSALNEIIAIKNDLNILQDRSGRRLKEYRVEVVNDELIVTDEEGELFEYNPNSKESQRVQEALFHEKQTIIENCLFGVDINPNSVKICRLRLWIELLKNAYYKDLNKDLEGFKNLQGLSARPELETLPNIDINIKCGNSLISRFGLDADLSKALKNSKWNMDSYRIAVETYRNAHNKEQKREMEKIIHDIKNDFRSEISSNDKKVKNMQTVKSKLYLMTEQPKMFELSKKEKTAWNKEVEKLSKRLKKLETEIQEIKDNKIYENAFEWRFEFPEVLDDNGDYLGFDVVIGNPPYIRQEELKEFKTHFKTQFKLYTGTADVYIFFIEKGFDILRDKGIFNFIMPNKFMQAGYGKLARKFLLEQNLIEIIDFGDYQVFDEATTYPCILIASKDSPQDTFQTAKINSPDFTLDFPLYISTVTNIINHNSLNDETWIVSNTEDQGLLQKVLLNGKKLEEYIKGGAKRGVLTGLSEAFVIDKEKVLELIEANINNQKYLHPFLMGREVKPYFALNPSKYLIKFEKGFTKKFGGNQPEVWFANEFPELFNHLKEFKEKAIKRTDKGDFYWELRACDYYDQFEKPKIMYQVFQVKPCFIYDEDGLYSNNSMWFIPSDDKVLLGILNSKMGWWLISKYCTAIQNGFQLIWKYFSQIPIATGNEAIREKIAILVNEILSIKKQDSTADTTTLENQIDQMVYELYGLSEEEIAIVERS